MYHFSAERGRGQSILSDIQTHFYLHLLQSFASLLDHVTRELVDYLAGSSVSEAIRHQSIHPVIVGREEPLEGGRERERERGERERVSDRERERLTVFFWW